jgi:uncharacterized protein
MIPVVKDGIGRLLTLPEFEALTGAAFINRLEFESDAVLEDIREKTRKLQLKGKLSKEQLWLGSYYKKEIAAAFIPEVTVRWIDGFVGWGVFAAKAFKKGEFIAEYFGKVRRRRRQDKYNSYGFEYAIAPHVRTRYTIDAETQGGLARFVNHSDHPNVLSAPATVDSVSHVILIAGEPIQEGEQLCYDYGPDYWSRRSKPRNLQGP